MAVVFEKGDREHELHKGFNDADKVDPKHKDLRSLAFLPKQTTLLQPADLIAGKVREVLNRARAHGPLDNGDYVTQVTSFSEHYVSNGTSASILKRGTGMGVPFCYVANRKLLRSADLNFLRLFREQPRTLARYTKDLRNQGKRGRLKT
jgi:hypothetical protein